MSKNRAVLQASIEECGLLEHLEKWENILGYDRIKTAETLLSRAADDKATVTFEGTTIIADVPFSLVKQFKNKRMKPAEILSECLKMGQPRLNLVSG